MATLDDHWSVTDPNWEPGRDRLEWLITLAEHPVVAPVAERLRDVLARPYLRRVPSDGLHVTLHDVAVEGRIEGEGLERLVWEARDACGRCPAVQLQLGAPRLMRTAVVLPVEPADALDELRGALHDADCLVRGRGARPLPKGAAAAPHVTLAYASRAALADDLEAVLAAVTLDATFVVEELSLVRLTRSYRWDVLARVGLR